MLIDFKALPLKAELQHGVVSHPEVGPFLSQVGEKIQQMKDRGAVTVQLEYTTSGPNLVAFLLGLN